MSSQESFAYVIVPGLIVALALAGYGLAVWATPRAPKVALPEERGRAEQPAREEDRVFPADKGPAGLPP